MKAKPRPMRTDKEGSLQKDATLNAAALRMALDPSSWRIVSSLVAAEKKTVRDERHEAWMKRHTERHRAREVLLALDGRGLYGFQGRVYRCEPGTVFLFDTHEAHDRFYPPRSPRLRHLWLSLLHHGVIARIRDIEGDTARTSGAPLPLTGTEAEALLKATWNDLKRMPSLPATLRRAKLTAALAAIFAQWAEENCRSKTGAQKQSFQEQIICSVKRHVEEHAGCGISLEEAARLSGYSKYHFLRLFRRHTGQTYHAYADACRLTRAKRLLDEGLRNKDIAEALGFAHASAFLRWSKKTGLRSVQRANGNQTG